jgi:hypothetical protein
VRVPFARQETAALAVAKRAGIVGVDSGDDRAGRIAWPGEHVGDDHLPQDIRSTLPVAQTAALVTEFHSSEDEVPYPRRAPPPMTSGRDHDLTIEDPQEALIGAPAVRGAEMRDRLDTRVPLHKPLVIRPVICRASEPLEERPVGLDRRPPDNLAQLDKGTVNGGTTTPPPAARRASTLSATETGSGSSLK